MFEVGDSQLVQQFHSVIRLMSLLCFHPEHVDLCSHAHAPTVPRWLVQLQDQAHTHNKMEKGVSEFSAPASLLYKRKSFN